MRGRNLKGSVVNIAECDEPETAHIEKAERLMPPGLLDSEVAIWEHTGPILCMLGRLEAHFVDALYEYCIVRARLDSARIFLDENGWTYETDNGQRKSRPEVGQLNDDFRKWRTLLGEFGLAPTSDRGHSTNKKGTATGWDKL